MGAYGLILAMLLALLACFISVPAGAQRLAAPSASTVAKVTPPPTSAVVVQPGDMVRVTVWRKPELSGDFLVASDSTLKHPLFQDIKVGGLSVPDAHKRVEDYLRRLETNPQVSIEPLFRVSVGGEVRNPNLYSLSPETNIAQAVALAGGANERGRLDRVRLLRGGSESMIDLTAASGEALRSPIASGDQLIVGRRGDFMRDYGALLFSAIGAAAAITSLFLHR